MVPRLRGVVEQALVALRLGGADDLDVGRIGQRRVLDRGVRLVDIGLVVLAVVERQGRADMYGSSDSGANGSGGRVNMRLSVDDKAGD